MASLSPLLRYCKVQKELAAVRAILSDRAKQAGPLSEARPRELLALRGQSSLGRLFAETCGGPGVLPTCIRNLPSAIDRLQPANA